MQNDIAEKESDVIAGNGSLGTFFAGLGPGNPYFSAGFGLMAIGAGLTLTRQVLVRGSGLLYRRMLVDLEISSRDKSYTWFLDWMAKYPRRSSRNLSVRTQYIQHQNGSVITKFELVPGPGKHLIRYEGLFILVNRERSGRLLDVGSGSPLETVTLTTLYRHRNVLEKILSRAQTDALVTQQGRTVLYTSFGPEWRPFGQPRRKRALESVILHADIKEKIVRDLENFLASGSWYHDRGVPYRRGILLYGPPGSGKSSLIQALAGHLDYDICILNLSEPTLTDDRLNHLINHMPSRSLLLLEDVDAAFRERKQTSQQGYLSGVTFSGLLNAIDGVAASDERIIFMTTNHPEKLDPALIRPGRVDVKQLLDNASEDQVRRMFSRFYPGSDQVCEQFVSRIVSRGRHVSVAQLQGVFVSNKGNPLGALASIDVL